MDTDTELPGRCLHRRAACNNLTYIAECQSDADTLEGNEDFVTNRGSGVEEGASEGAAALVGTACYRT